jgi:hypothetical protein
MINDLAVDSVRHEFGDYGTLEKINGLAEPYIQSRDGGIKQVSTPFPFDPFVSSIESTQQQHLECKQLSLGSPSQQST